LTNVDRQALQVHLLHSKPVISEARHPYHSQVAANLPGDSAQSGANQGTNARNRNAAKSTRCTAPCIM
jgi:hypothetical protein